jgi:hypothetical protein
MQDSVMNAMTYVSFVRLYNRTLKNIGINLLTGNNKLSAS